MGTPGYILWLDEITLDDVPRVGGKNASLGEMIQALAPRGVPVPGGFAVTADAYRRVVGQADVKARIDDLLAGLDKADLEDFARRGRALREAVYGAVIPDDLAGEIADAYRRLETEYGADVDVAVRSSATAEDLPSASFAGQHETFLNVHSVHQLLDACRRCFASLFTDRAISYRIDQGFDHADVALSIGVQKMVRADRGSAGVIFTLDPESGFRDVVLITAAYGLGETVVQGTVSPDEFYVHKPTFEDGHRTVLRRTLGGKHVKMIYADGSSRLATRTVPTPPASRDWFCLRDQEVLTLADHALKIERHYSERAGRPMPMDIEWAKDGLTGELYILQARPETVRSQEAPNLLKEYRLTGSAPVLASGRAVGDAIASGPVRIIHDVRALASFQTGEVLVARTTTPDWEPVMKRAAAIVTDLGGRTCHAAIVARELGIPAIVGAGGATDALEAGAPVTVSCAEGDEGHVYAGQVPFDVQAVDVAALARPQTKIMVNLGNPDRAFQTGLLPCDGVGLARIEFIIAEAVRAHPMALIHPERVADKLERAELKQLIGHHRDGAAFFVEKLSEGVGTIAAAFYPRPVIVRLSDFKTNEYAALLGGRFFETAEANPMIGFRGAARYAHPAYAEGFALECAAMRRVRHDMGLTNVRLMIPFCRRAEEADRVLEAMAHNGLTRGTDGLEVYVMCEIPANVLAVDAFAERFDGFSIGSNDLTQLVLGVDRDSDIVAFDFDERDPAVLEAVRLAIQGAHRHGRPIGICGQAPSDYPDFAAFLVAHGIDSISLNPDSVLKTTRAILDAETERDARARRAAGG